MKEKTIVGKKQKLFSRIAVDVSSMRYCFENDTSPVIDYEDRMLEIEKKYLPYGSGFDSGCSINFEESSSDKIVIYFDYHIAKDDGSHLWWHNCVCEVTPSLINGYDLEIYLQNDNKRGAEERNAFNLAFDYIHDTFSHCLEKEVIAVAHYNDNEGLVNIEIKDYNNL